MLAKPRTVAGPRLFKPDFIADSVKSVDFKLLQSLGIKAVLIDLDGTVVSRGKFDVDKNLSNYLKKQTLKIYIATNRPKSRDLKSLKLSLHATGVIHPHGVFMKPLPKYFKRAALTHGLKPKQVAMIGDRYLQDIYGANRAGLTTVLVRKVGPPKGPLDTRLSNFENKHTDKLATRYIPAKITRKR